MPNQVELCEAVKDWLNATEQQTAFSETFTATHQSKRYIDEPTAGTLYVIVAPGDRANQQFNKTSFQKTVEVVVSVIERINTRQESVQQTREIALRTLHEEIEDAAMRLTLGTEYTRDTELGQSTPGFDTNELYENGTFNGDVTMTFTYFVEKPRA